MKSNIEVLLNKAASTWGKRDTTPSQNQHPPQRHRHRQKNRKRKEPDRHRYLDIGKYRKQSRI